MRDLVLSGDEKPLILRIGDGTTLTAQRPTVKEYLEGAQHSTCETLIEREPPNDFAETLSTADVGTTDRVPSHISSFLLSVGADLWRHTRRCIDVLRWRAGAGGPSNPFSICGFEWSVDRRVWHAAQRVDLEAFLMSPQPVLLSKSLRDDAQRLVTEGVSRPLGHQLFREAWAGRLDTPRSSLVIGLAGAEVGLKEFLAELAPDAGWLLENTESPPLSKLLRRYLPWLLERRQVPTRQIALPGTILSAPDKGVELRNKTAHRGEAGPEGKRLEDFLLAVSDLLSLLDYHRGQSWALERIQPETRRAMGLPTPL